MALITIGGSEIAAVLNEGYGCTRALFYRKIGCESENPLTDDNPHIRRGKDMEPIIVGKFEIATGLYVETPERLGEDNNSRGVLIEGKEDWQSGHADGIVYNKQFCGTALGVLECKAPADRSFKTIKAEGLPIDYSLQLQYYMALAEVNIGYFAIHGCGENWEFIHWAVEADKVLQNMIMSECQQFVDDVIAGNMPAQLQDDDKRCKRCEYRKLCRDIEIDYSEDMVNYQDDDILIDAVMEYEKQGEIIDQAEVIRDEMKEIIKEQMGGLGKGYFDNCKITHYDSTRDNFDGKEFDKDYPGLRKKYTKPGKQSTTLKITRSKK